MEHKNSYIADFFKSKKFKALFYGFAIAVLALLIFQAGVFVGYHKAEFSYRWGDNYSKTFGLIPGMMQDGFQGANGTIGKIISINLPDIMLENNDKTEKNIITDDDTSVRRFRERISASDLKVGDLVVVIGSPDDKGQIRARLIRLIPPPAAALSTTTQIQQ